MIELRQVSTRGGHVTWMFLAGARYAALELDPDGDVVALLADRSVMVGGSDAWVVPLDGADYALARIRRFLEPPEAA